MAELVQARYARSLFEVAVEANCQDKAMDELNLISVLIDENPDFLKLLSAKTVSKQELKNIVNKVFGERVSEFIINMLMIMIDNGRITLIQKVIDSYKNIYYDYKNMIEVTAITAIELSNINQERLSERLSELTGKKPIIKNVVDASILGGVILKIRNEQIDNSIKGKLDELKKQLSTLTI